MCVFVKYRFLPVLAGKQGDPNPNAVTFRKNEITFRKNEITFRKNELLVRNY